MVDNQHQRISGYRDLSQEEIDLMNRVKEVEAGLAVLLGGIDTTDYRTARWMALSRTHLETGFMFAVKAIARPIGGIG